MSDTMLHGILNMPPDLWSDTPIDQAARHARYVEASRQIIDLERQRDEAMAAATWAVQWLDTVIDRLQHEASIKELFEDMAKVRETNSVLDGEWNRCGWTGTQAARFLKNWRKEEA
jgi:hypothetical protein